MTCLRPDERGGFTGFTATNNRRADAPRLPFFHACQQRAWRRYKSELLGFIANRIGDKASADDLLQEVFVKALLQGEAFCALDNPRAWLFHVTRNLLVDRLRLTKEMLPLPDDLGDPSSLDGRAEGGGEGETVDLLTQCLPRVLAELSPEDRDAIVQCDLQGLAQIDYARRLGISLPAAKSRIRRARQRLQQQLVSACQVRFDESGKVCCFVPRPPAGA